MFISRQLKATRFGFGEGLKVLGQKNTQIVALGADITSSVSMNFFKEAFPDRFFSMGIAEQNVVGVATGLALGGKIPFVATYGVFAALRTTDQIRVSVCYNNLPVKIGGAHAGISVGPDGATHQALEDIAIMRVLPNMTVLSPCDATQTKLATIASVEQVKGPAYIRFGREPVPDFTSEEMIFEVGKGQTFKEGTDITIIATGHIVWEALQAAYQLEKQNINARVINIHTIKPVDKDIIIKAARETGLIITAEEHQIIGGLGSAVAEVLVKFAPVPVQMIGMNDRFGESGQPDELLEKYGMKAEHIISAAIELLKKYK
ncbi:MAG: transketolase [Bacteroidetes bacterium GWC2_33_15]|nr:MAG: transketolase [Bacteroidetes bacterium GWA2_33_15]OFX51236.1 MAG: transketolase [Bacteroidetes bacterium GWC2_33_15]OFX66346.1 MAG: transketolase [Bacteroidetes bacterium GWB2_32_14]OFX70639.1 MAG: transketolase [Bacteroidetes bacterium GWD2_33_33]HAN18774.1 transketolase [Bacteroidales bacterium]